MAEQAANVQAAWTALCADLNFSPTLVQTGEEMLRRLLAMKDTLSTAATEQALLQGQLAAVAFLANSKQPEAGFSIAKLVLRLGVPMKDFFSAVEEQNSRLQPGVPLDDFRALKAVFVIGTVVFSKWKAFFPSLFPAGFVGGAEGSPEYERSFELGWLLFSIAKASLLGPKAGLMEAYHLLAVVAHFLLAHVPGEARGADFWAQLRLDVPPECYPLPPDAQAALFKKLIARPEDVARQQEAFGALVEQLKPLLGLTQPTPTHGQSGGEGAAGFLRASTLQPTIDSLRAQYEQIWPARMPIDELIFMQLPAAAPRPAPSTPGSPSRGGGASGSAGPSDQLLTPLRRPSQAVMPAGPPPSTPFSSQLESVGWLKEAMATDVSPRLQRFYEACVDLPTLRDDIGERLERLCGRVRAKLQASEVPCDIDERILLGTRVFFKMLLAFLEAEEVRLQRTEFGALLGNESFHTSLFACCMEGVFASYSMHEMAFPAVTELLELHPFDFGKVIESFVKHEPGLPAHLRQHYQQVEARVIESLAWAHDSPLHILMQEYSASMAASGTEGGTVRAKAALQQFLKKTLYLAASRIQDMCLRLLLPNTLVQQVWGCVKVVLDSAYQLLTNRHLDQIIMCSVYGVCKVNQRQVTFRHIIEQYKRQPTASPKVFREVCMATPDEEPQDIIKFYNQIFIPAMKDQLLIVCHSTTANGGPGSPTINQPVGASPQRVTQKADVYVSQPRTPSASMTPRTRTLYAFSDTPAHATTTSEGLRAINQTINANAAGTDSAAQTLQALSSSMSPPPQPADRGTALKRGLNLTTQQPADPIGAAPRRVMQRRLARERDGAGPAADGGAAGEAETA